VIEVLCASVVAAMFQHVILSNSPSLLGVSIAVDQKAPAPLREISIRHIQDEVQPFASAERLSKFTFIQLFVEGDFGSVGMRRRHGANGGPLVVEDSKSLAGGFTFGPVKSTRILHFRGRALAKVLEHTNAFWNFASCEVGKLDRFDTQVCPRLSFAHFTCYSNSILGGKSGGRGLFKGNGDIKNANGSDRQHQQGPSRHFLLGFQVIIFGGLFIWGVERLFEARRSINKTARRYAFDEAFILMFGSGLASFFALYVAINKPYG